MTANLNFRIGGLGIELCGDLDLEYIRKGCFVKFLSTEIPHARYQIKINQSPIEPSVQPLFTTENGWRLYQYNSHWVLWIPSMTTTPYLVGSFNPGFRSGEIFTSESKHEAGKYIFPISYPLGEILMTNLLGTGYGIMLHACGVIDKGDGMIFAGKSNAGKTTTASLWNINAGVRVVNDDHIILRKTDKGFRIYGTPWHGQGGFALAEDAPLKKIFILKHARSNQAELLPRSQAAAAILVRTFAPFWSAPAMAFTLQFLDELCQTIPCYQLGFVPDQSSVEYVRCLPSK